MMYNLEEFISVAIVENRGELDLEAMAQQARAWFGGDVRATKLTITRDDAASAYRVQQHFVHRPPPPEGRLGRAVDQALNDFLGRSR